MSDRQERDSVAISERASLVSPTQHIQNTQHTRDTLDAHASQRRGRERDAEFAKRAILAAAEEMFAREGFAGARVDAIAEASGYNKALLFHYFGDKLGLYREVVCMRRDEVSQLICDVLLEAAGDPNVALDRAQVRAFIERAVGWTFDHLAEHPHLRQIMAWEAAQGWETFIAAKREMLTNATWVQPVSEYIRRAQEAGIMRRDVEPRMLIAHVLGMPLSYLISIPRYEVLFGIEDMNTPAALALAREQIIQFAVHAAMTDLKETPDAVGV